MKEMTLIQLTGEDLKILAKDIATQILSEMNKQPKFYSVKEVAEMFSVSYRTIQNWIAKRELKATFLGGKVLISDESIRETCRRKSTI